MLFDTFDTVDHQDDRIHGGQRTIGVLGEVLVTGRIEDVDPPALVIEAHHRGGNRDTALFLDLHEVGGSGFSDLVTLHRTGRDDRAAEEEEFFGEGRLTGVGVTDDAESPAFRDFLFELHGTGG